MRQTECQRCGDHWPVGNTYCGTCGYAAEEAPAPAEAGHHRPGVRRLLVAGLLTLAIAGATLPWWWSDADSDARPVATTVQPVDAPPTMAPPAVGGAGLPPAAAEPGTASKPAQAVAAAGLGPAAVPAQAPAGVASAPDTPPPAAEPPTTRPLAEFARQWLEAEARGGAAADLAALRGFYAPTVAYRGQANADWATIAADKTRFAQRWPQRRYQLQQMQRLADGEDGTQRALLQVSWQLERQGRWRRGQSVTLLEWRTVEGQLRIVTERAD